ncbi:MAG: hypothetical protein NXI31_01860 [bacterium]|nr:hypothetical protein [bacterium]
MLRVLCVVALAGLGGCLGHGSVRIGIHPVSLAELAALEPLPRWADMRIGGVSARGGIEWTPFGGVERRVQNQEQDDEDDDDYGVGDAVFEGIFGLIGRGLEQLLRCLD